MAAFSQGVPFTILAAADSHFWDLPESQELRGMLVGSRLQSEGRSDTIALLILKEKDFRAT